MKCCLVAEFSYLYTRDEAGFGSFTNGKLVAGTVIL